MAFKDGSSHRRHRVLFGWLVVVLASLLNSLSASAYTIPDSGQTKCFNNTDQITCPTDPTAAFYGQDASRMTAPMSMTDNGNQTVTDHNTGLLWQQSGTTTPTTWDAAVAYCQQLSLGGQTGWRLPTRRELGSLPSMDRDSPAASYLLTLPNTSENDWSGTEVYGDATKVYIYSTGGGQMDTVSKTSPGPTMTTRCVHGDTLPGFTASLDTETIADTSTNLMWQRNPNQTGLTWQNALSYCETSQTGGYTDWRLPTITELFSLLSDTTTQPALPNGFGNPGSPPIFWSGDTLNYNKDNAMVMNVYTEGRSYRWSKVSADMPKTICVRSGPSQAAVLGTFAAGAVTAPASGASLPMGQTTTLVWNASAVTGSTVDLYAIVDTLAQLDDTAPDAAVASRLASVKFAGNVANSGAYAFTPASLNVVGSQVKILVVSNTGSWGLSQGTFSVSNSLTAPTALAATAVTATGFTANWSAAYGATSYELAVYDITAQAFVSGYGPLNVGNVTTYAVTGLTPGHHYQYAVKAKNSSTTTGASNVIDVQCQAALGTALNMLLLDNSN